MYVLLHSLYNVLQLPIKVESAEEVVEDLQQSEYVTDDIQVVIKNHVIRFAYNILA